MNSINKNLNEYMIEYMIYYKDANNQHHTSEVEQVNPEAMDIDKEDSLSKQVLSVAKILDSQPGDLSIKRSGQGSQTKERQFEQYAPQTKVIRKIDKAKKSTNRGYCQWRSEEEKIILEKIKEFGQQKLHPEQWNQIFQCLPGRTHFSVKTRFSKLKQEAIKTEQEAMARKKAMDTTRRCDLTRDGTVIWTSKE